MTLVYFFSYWILAGYLAGYLASCLAGDLAGWLFASGDFRISFLESVFARDLVYLFKDLVFLTSIESDVLIFF